MKISIKKLLGKALNFALKAVEHEAEKRLKNKVNAGVSSVDEPTSSNS